IEIIRVFLIEHHVKVRLRVVEHQCESFQRPCLPIVFGNKMYSEIRGSQTSQRKHQHLDYVGVSNHLHTPECYKDGEHSEPDHTQIEVESRYCTDGKCTEEKDRSEINNDVE